MVCDYVTRVLCMHLRLDYTTVVIATTRIYNYVTNYSVSECIPPVAECNYSIHIHCSCILQHHTNRIEN